MRDRALERRERPEYLYAVTTNQPGLLTVSVADDAATDIDVELFSQMNTSACIARNDSAFTQAVGCGTYFVVADTFGTSAGPYTLTMTFAPSGSACTGGPPAFTPEGALGDACAYPGSASLPMCNPNLGADTCIYGTNDSFCSKPCKVDADCAAMPGGRCCQDIGTNGPELYCMTSSSCPGGSSGGTSSGGSSSGGGSSRGGTSSGGSSSSRGTDMDAGTPNDDPSSTDPTGNGPQSGGQPVSTSSGCNASSSDASNGFFLFAPAIGVLAARRRSRRS